MKINLRRMKMRYIGFLAFLVCITTVLDISYLNIMIKNFGVYKIIYFAIVFFIELLWIIYKKPKIRNQHLPLVMAGCIVFVSTILNKGSVVNYISIMLPIIMVCLVIVSCKNWAELNNVLNIWCIIMFILLIVDIISILLWPMGLYRTSFDSRNWFLGYKTNRLRFTFPLLVFYSYSTVKNVGEINIKCILLSAMVAVDAILSKGTAGSSAILSYSALLFIFFFNKPKKDGKIGKLLMRLFGRPSYFLPSYLLIIVLVIILQNQRIIQNIVILFNKTETLSGRTIIWGKILASLNGHWLLGRGALTSQQYLQITGDVLNAHNVILTYLVTGGIVGLFLILSSIIITAKNSYDLKNYILYFYIFFNLCIGITSSSLAFCPYFFAIMLVPSQIQQRSEKISINLANCARGIEL